ncbi:ABC-type transport auxiliary lipoprotein family protein [Paraburkholderia sp.]|uniref:PqiC family protein n=1 Tax=Paraburkholderia sp. TaxID=1926495 RepID=UPI0023832414|nr:ABC-type transport auxiliary lipoprotein family protein [Paraburkholderia sp.]MDE1180903.1 ABC-type transport auxiliary lipoprotein family protein [Paraburkholderia sp.]
MNAIVPETPHEPVAIVNRSPRFRQKLRPLAASPRRHRRFDRSQIRGQRTLDLSQITAGKRALPVHYHTLVAPTQQRDPAGTHAPFVLDVLPVRVPSHLDQTTMVLRRGDTRVDILETERWASPSGSEVRAALSTEQTRRLGTYDIAGLSASSDSAVVRVKVPRRRFDAWSGEAVQLDADCV